MHNKQQPQKGKVGLEVKQQQEPIEINIKCSGINNVVQFCIKPTCQAKNPFTCQAKDCKCYKEHYSCLKANVDYTLEQIKGRIKKTFELKIQIENTFKNLIDKISKAQEDLLKLVDEKIKFIELRQVERQFLKEIQSKSQQYQMKAKQMNLLWRTIKSPILNQKTVESLMKHETDRLTENINADIIQFDQRIKQLIQDKEYDRQNGNNHVLKCYCEGLDRKDPQYRDRPQRKKQRGSRVNRYSSRDEY